MEERKIILGCDDRGDKLENIEKACRNAGAGRGQFWGFMNPQDLLECIRTEGNILAVITDDRMHIANAPEVGVWARSVVLEARRRSIPHQLVYSSTQVAGLPPEVEIIRRTTDPADMEAIQSWFIRRGVLMKGAA